VAISTSQLYGTNQQQQQTVTAAKNLLPTRHSSTSLCSTHKNCSARIPPDEEEQDTGKKNT